MTSLKSLQQALKEITQDHPKANKFDAQVIKELILADGKISKEEQRFLEQALKTDKFDEKAHEMLAQLLLRVES